MEKELTVRFEDLFKDDIDGRNACTISKHSINTGNNFPIASRNHRIQVNWESEIDKEDPHIENNTAI